MILKAGERMIMAAFYPQKGDLLAQTLVKEIDKKVGFSQEEAIKIKKAMDGSIIYWDRAGIEDKEVVFSKVEIKFLKERIADLDKRKEITIQMVDFCYKIKESE